jgi:cytochrome c oxidase subunit II
MLPELLFAIIVFAAVFLLLFKSSLPARWKYLVQQTVTGGLIIWLLAVGWVAFSGLLAPAVGPRPVHATMEQTKGLNLLQLVNSHPRTTFYVAPAVGPILIIVWLFALMARGMRQADPPANQEPDLIVIGHQWWWEIRYPQTGVVTANEIHLPVGRKWLVRLESADVIHDFWVPALARKIQLIPGQTNHIWLAADAAGAYDGECAEYCGAQHSWMRFSVIAESPAAFDGWLREQEKSSVIPATDSTKNGLKIFRTLACINCHSLRGVSVAASAAPGL